MQINRVATNKQNSNESWLCWHRARTCFCVRCCCVESEWNKHPIDNFKWQIPLEMMVHCQRWLLHLRPRSNSANDPRTMLIQIRMGWCVHFCQLLPNRSCPFRQSLEYPLHRQQHYPCDRCQHQLHVPSTQFERMNRWIACLVNDLLINLVVDLKSRSKAKRSKEKFLIWSRKTKCNIDL